MRRGTVIALLACGAIVRTTNWTGRDAPQEDSMQVKFPVGTKVDMTATGVKGVGVVTSEPYVLWGNDPGVNVQLGETSYFCDPEELAEVTS
jgi:hypothetical protein